MTKKSNKHQKQEEKATKKANRVTMKQTVNDLKDEKAAAKVCKKLLLRYDTIFILLGRAKLMQSSMRSARQPGDQKELPRLLDYGHAGTN